MTTKREQQRSEVLDAARAAVFDEIFTTPREIEVAKKTVSLLGQRAVIEALDQDPAFKGGTRQATRLQEFLNARSYSCNVRIWDLGKAAEEAFEPYSHMLEVLEPGEFYLDGEHPTEEQVEIDRGLELAMQIAEPALRLPCNDSRAQGPLVDTIETIITTEWHRYLEAEEAKIKAELAENPVGEVS